MTQEELARKAGVAPATVSRVRHGQTPMTIDQLESFCRVLRLDPADVVSEATAR